MNFEYNSQYVALKNIDIEDIGKVAIRATNDLNAEYYLIIKSNAGTTEILTFGPIIPDIELLPKKVLCSYERIEYNQKKLSKIISTFLNDNFKNIEEAKIIDAEEALDYCRDLSEYMRYEHQG